MYLNIILAVRSFMRFSLLCARYPKAALAFFLRVIGHIPGFKYVTERDISAAKEFKKQGRLQGYNIGHATHNKNIYLDFCGIVLLQVTVEEGEMLTAEHFFLNRSIQDVKLLLELCASNLVVNKSSLVFDPACGTGRHLQFIVDKFNCKGVGIDVSCSAINVASNANIGDNVKFYCASSLDPKITDTLIPHNIDLVFINSWLGYVVDTSGFSDFISIILDRAKLIMVISSIDDDIHSIFNEADFIIYHIVGGTQYSLIKKK